MEHVNTFERSLKPRAVEEFLDYYFYRRVAHWMVPAFIRFGVTPNQVTTLSLASGLLASWFAWKSHFIISAVFCFTAIFLDCSDGQIARLTGKSSHMGHVLDGLFDLIWSTALWLGIYHSGYFQKAHLGWIFWIMFAAAVSFILHGWRFDGVKNFILKWSGNRSADNPLTMEDYKKIFREGVRGKKWGTAFLAATMLFQLFFFVWEAHGEKKTAALSEASRQIVKEALEPMLPLWSWLGVGHHHSVVIAGLLFSPITPYPLLVSFFILILPMNLWYFFCEFRWRKGLKTLRQKGIEV